VKPLIENINTEESAIEEMFSDLSQYEIISIIDTLRTLSSDDVIYSQRFKIQSKNR
jgi:hypothetical protein